MTCGYSSLFWSTKINILSRRSFVFYCSINFLTGYISLHKKISGKEWKKKNRKSYRILTCRLHLSTWRGSMHRAAITAIANAVELLIAALCRLHSISTWRGLEHKAAITVHSQCYSTIDSCPLSSALYIHVERLKA